MAKTKLVDVGYSKFYFRHKDEKAHKKKDREQKQKLVSSDKFDAAITGLVKNLKDNNLATPLILTNAAGGDTPYSLYANLANIHPRRFPPQLLVLDRKRVNLENMNYRAALATLNGNRLDYITDLFGLEQGTLTEEVLTKKGSIDVKELQKILRRNNYDGDRHSETLEGKLELSGFVNDYDDMNFVSEVFMNIANHLESRNNYKEFVDQFSDILHLNPKTHYLHKEELYKHMTRLLVPEKKKFNMHLTKLDIGSPTGLERAREILESYNFGTNDPTITVSFIPHVMKKMESVVPFLRENSLYTMYSQQRFGEKDRTAVITQSSTLAPKVADFPYLSKYKEIAAQHKPYKNLSPIEPVEGLEPTMFLSHPNIGHVNADEKARKEAQDVAKETGVKKIICSNANWGAHFLIENKLRLITDREYKTNDSQFREFKKYREGFVDKDGKRIPMVYVYGENDRDILENLVNLHMNENIRRKTGHAAATSGVSVTNRRQFYNSEQDMAREYMPQVYAYMLRKGQDVTHMYTEDVLGTTIIELVDIFSRLAEGKKLTKEDLKIVDEQYIKEDPNFIIRERDYSSFEGKVNGALKADVGLRALSKVNQSEKTEYAQPTKGLEKLTDTSQNGTLDDFVPEQILADMRSAHQEFRIMGDKGCIWTPHLMDDRRMLERNAPGKVMIPQDPTFKRVNGSHNLNIAGFNVLTGNIKERTIFKPYYDKVLRRMEEVQKTGQGYNLKRAVLLHDAHINGMHERPEMLVKYLDYALFERGSSIFIGVGDNKNARNYEDSVHEGALLGNTVIDDAELALWRLIRPYATSELLEYFGYVYGNHEENTDKRRHGKTMTTSIISGMEQHLLETGRKDLQVDIPRMIKTVDGDIMYAPIGHLSINDFNIMYTHMFTRWGGGGSRPIASTEGWSRKMREAAKQYDAFLGGHLHVFEASVRDNKFHLIGGVQAGGGPYEYRGQLAGTAPVGTILGFREDGSYEIEIISERFLEDYKVQHPLVQEVGVDNFIYDAITRDVSATSPYSDQVQAQKIYQRPLREKSPVVIK